MAERRRAVFLDRDGTLIVDTHYPSDPAAVALIDGVVGALRKLRELGWALVVVSNQSGVGRGWVTRVQFEAVADRFAAMLAERGVTLDGAYYCLHAPEQGCACRKPAPGALLLAADELGLDLARSAIVGDKPSDIEAGRAAGVSLTIRVAFARPDGDPGLRSWDDVLAAIIGQPEP